MKKFTVLFFLLFVFFLSCNNITDDRKSNVSTEKQIIENNNEACLIIKNKKYNFGKISREKYPCLDLDFELKNTGKTPLVISKIDVSCGCLSVSYSKFPINPDKETKLTVHIDTKKQYGFFSKVIFINSNAKNNLEIIRITGEVEK